MKSKYFLIFFICILIMFSGCSGNNNDNVEQNVCVDSLKFDSSLGVCVDMSKYSVDSSRAVVAARDYFDSDETMSVTDVRELTCGGCFEVDITDGTNSLTVITGNYQVTGVE